MTRVLVIEDSSDLAQGLRYNLELEGYAVKVAEDGGTGLSLAREWDPDLVILDMNLSVLSGYQTVRMVRAWGGRSANVPILALTDDVHPAAPARCLSAGATDYIVKPLLDVRTLRAKVRAALAHPNQP